MWMRYTLARMTPLLRHLLATGVTHPFELHTALIETPGALAAFQSAEPVELPPYDHDDLHGCFRKLIDFIDVQLGETIPTHFTKLKMGFDAKELTQWVVDHGKAGSRSGVKTPVMLNVEGLRLEHLPGAPTEIAAPDGFEFYIPPPQVLAAAGY
jgi:predicted component of type VI protein secretion system